MHPRISYVAAAHNEVGSLPILLPEIRTVAASLGPYEIVIVDDGSTDESGAWLAAEAEQHADLRVVTMPENRGQSPALAAGLTASRGEIIVTMDADLQNDPADTPLLLAALENADLACGVRATRRDTFAKRIGSRVGNGVRRMILRDRFRDVGCALKAWRRPVAERIPKFTGFHRFVPVLAQGEGFRVVEVEVSHRPRDHGRTHYGNMGRALHGLRDLMGVAWLRDRREDFR